MISFKYLEDWMNSLYLELLKMTYLLVFSKLDFVAVCEMPQSIDELFFMFPKANYPLTVKQLDVAIMKRWDSTVVLLQVVGNIGVII